jgi:hypothetical protein
MPRISAPIATVALGALLCASAGAFASDAETPVAVKQSAECMYHLLTTMTGVNEPKLGYITSEGWIHPFVEYRGAWRDGTIPVRFEAQKPIANHKGYWFLFWFAGPPPPGFNLDLMESIIQTWEAQCRADVEWQIN